MILYYSGMKLLISDYYRLGMDNVCAIDNIPDI
jgi:hypothetical protein